MRTVLTLFSGACGGWDLGMERAGYRVVAACESDPWRRAALQRNFPNSRIYDDVRTLTADRLRADLGALPDVIVGSPPCQDASSANSKGRGVDGERTGLFFEAIRIVAECRPVWCCLENVPGLRTRGVDRVLAGLEEAGYTVWPLVVGAVHVGAPHRRNRVWIIAADPAALQRASLAGREPDGVDAGARTDAYGQGQHAVAEHGEVGGLAGDGGPAADADEARWRPSGATERQASRRDLDRFGLHAKDAAGPAADADEARRAGGYMDLGLREAEESEHRRAFAQAWPDWNGGFAGFGRMDDGLPRGVARAALAAYGDAVVPQITEAIGRAMSSLLP